MKSACERGTLRPGKPQINCALTVRRTIPAQLLGPQRCPQEGVTVALYSRMLLLRGHVLLPRSEAGAGLKQTAEDQHHQAHRPSRVFTDSFLHRSNVTLSGSVKQQYEKYRL